MLRLRKYLPILPVLLGYVVLLVVGLLSPGHWQLISQLAFYCALGQAFNLFMGMTGYVDFGYVAFLGVGTYGMAVVIENFYDKGLGFGLIVLGILKAAFGKQTASALSTFWVDIMVIGVAVLAAVMTIVYLRNKVGYALTAVREDEDAAKAMGVQVTKYKITAFMTSAVLAGLLGATAWALKLSYVYPEDVFEIHYTVEAIIIVMLGGAGTLLGPMIGGLLYGLSKYFLAIELPGFQLLIFAPAMLIIIVLFPEGTVGVLKRKLVGTPLEKFII